jgi:hypothetical protein
MGVTIISPASSAGRSPLAVPALALPTTPQQEAPVAEPAAPKPKSTPAKPAKGGSKQAQLPKASSSPLKPAQSPPPSASPAKPVKPSPVKQRLELFPLLPSMTQAEHEDVLYARMHFRNKTEEEVDAEVDRKRRLLTMAQQLRDQLQTINNRVERERREQNLAGVSREAQTDAPTQESPKKAVDAASPSRRAAPEVFELSLRTIDNLMLPMPADSESEASEGEEAIESGDADSYDDSFEDYSSESDDDSSSDSDTDSDESESEAEPPVVLLRQTSAGSAVADPIAQQQL